MFHSKSQKRIAKALGSSHHFKSREKKVSMEVFQRLSRFSISMNIPPKIPLFNRRVNKSGKRRRTRGASVNTPLRV